MFRMLRKIAESVREYRKASLATPVLVSFEVVLECIIPFVIAELVCLFCCLRSVTYC